MKNSTSNKTKLTASIAIILLMISAFTVMINAPVQAQEYTNMQESGSIPLPSGVTPDVVVDTIPGLSVRPNPVGVDQPFLVNMWIIPSTDASQYLTGFEVTITDPDGNEDVITMDSYIGDATAWFEYIADQVGTWKLKFDFPGGYYPAGNYTRPTESFRGYGVISFEESVYYKPSFTPEQELVVQEDMVYSWPPSPLPTDYWTRPVSSDHREWWPILGDYPWSGPASGGPEWKALWDKLYPNTNKYWSSPHRFTPWVQGPNSAHIVWKRQDAIGGLMGGDFGQLSVPIAIIGVSNFPRIIYAGRCYQTFTRAVDGQWVGVWQCYDLRTGEVYWEHLVPITITFSALGSMSARTVTPTVIEYYIAGGEHPGSTAWIGVGTAMSLVYIGGGRLIKYDPWTGAVSLNVSTAPISSGTYYRNGYALSVQNLGGGNYRLINWTTFGRTDNFAERIASNITWPWSSVPSTTDYNVGIAARMSDVVPPGTAVITQVRVMAASLKTGAELWDITVDGDIMSGTEVADHGKIAFIIRGTRYCSAFNLQDGSLAWKSDELDYPWGQWLAYSSSGSAYGLFYELGLDGVYAFDWTNGKLVWKYEAPTYPYETPYTGRDGTTVYSFGGPLVIADGKVYAYNSEHTVTQPITRGWGLHCINAFTGEGIWNITGVATAGAVADGYLTAGSLQSGHMYVFGKGQSEITVTAPDVAVPKGTAITIKGTVLDQSPAQPDTPCVSKESMTTQMEYLHMQQPIGGIKGDAIITGVPVTLTAVDSDGNWIDIGTTTTNGYYGTFGIEWTPPDEGKYEIIASFEGDESYGSSGASTFVTVGPAPAEVEEVDLAPLEGSASDVEDSVGSQTTYIIAILVIVIIALVIAIYSALKPRK